MQERRSLGTLLLATILFTVGPTPTLALDLSQLVEMAPKLGLNTFLDLLAQAGLTDALAGNPGPLTIFAPSDQAFSRVPRQVLQQLGSDQKALQNLLLSHVITGKVLSSQLSDDLVAPSLLDGAPVRVNLYYKSDFYPGFATVNGKRVCKADLEIVGNGVVHVLSEVMFPIADKNLVELLEQDPAGRFSTLLAALEAADLVSVLQSDGPFTVFAPTNEAFAKIPASDLDALLADKAGLSQVLLRHVVPGTIFQKGITWMVHDTAGGDQIQTQVFKNGRTKVANRDRVTGNVVDVDLVATNGVAHVIDGVI